MRGRTRQIMAPVGLFILMSFWSWLATVGVIFTAERDLAAIPFELALATCSFLGLTSLRRTKVYALAWIGGAGVGTALGLYFP